MSGEVYSVRLVVQKQDAGFFGKWIDADGQESSLFPIVLPMGEEDAAELRWYLEKYHGFVGPGTRERARVVEKRIEDLGHRLFAACFGTVEGTHVHRNLLDAEKAGQPVLLTLGSNEPAFLQQPWELMRDRRGPLAFQGVSIRRQLIGAKPTPRFDFSLPLRILLIVARPNGAGFIDPRSSMGPLLDGLDALGGLVELLFCEPPTLAQLEQRISAARKVKAPFHIVHFDGHGTYLPETGVGALCFEKDDRGVDFVTGPRLGDLLARLDIPLVILEACRTSDLSDQPVVGSLAPALLESGVGSVVAFSHSVHIEASRILVERFYRELAAGLAVGQALSESRVALRAKPQRWLHLGPNAATVDMQDWFIPQLYQVGIDPVFLKSGVKTPEASEKVRPEERMFGFPPRPMYRFHGRAKDLLEMERAFEKHPALLLTGGGGMGKTALAREAAFWWLRTGRFELAVFVSFEQVVTVERVVQELGRALEGATFASRSGEDQEKTAVALFRDRKVLLVWDNFESTLPQFQQGEAGGIVNYPEAERARLRRFFEKLTEHGAATKGRLIVTCRPTESGLPGIRERALAGLERHDSLHLVHAIADIKEINLEREGYARAEMEKLLDLLGDHPLSLSLVGPQLKKLKPAEICADFRVLLDRFQDDTAEEGRNHSLRASLAFSTSRLSPAAQAVLPWLAWFQGGAFENTILLFTQLSEDAWSAIRAVLEGTALLRVEEVGLKAPFLRFHPTLSFAASPRDVGDVEAVELRFLGVYAAAMQWVDDALTGTEMAAGMLLMEREEGNFRSALELAFRRAEHRIGADLAETLGRYLQSAARLRERDVLVDWVQRQIPASASLDPAACGVIRRQALSLAGRGRAGEAVAMLQKLIQRLETESLEEEEEQAFQLGTSFGCLGQILVVARSPDLALSASQRAIEILEQVEGPAAKGNLAAALGGLADACRMLGRHEKALFCAEKGLQIDRQLGHHRNVAVGLDRCAEILRAQQHWTEAEARYSEALVLARQIGDFELQGIVLAHRGALHRERGDHERAVEDYEETIRLFQQAGDTGNEMRTCDYLATAEMIRGQFEAAEAWYGRSRELAVLLEDQCQLGVVAQNLGVLYQLRAEQTTGAEREVWLRRAVVSVEESLAIWLERKDRVGAAPSHFQLGRLHTLLGDLDRAQENAFRGLEITEGLGLPEAWRDYASLAEIAAARGDSASAAGCTAKRDAKLAELERLRAALTASG